MTVLRNCGRPLTRRQFAEELGALLVKLNGPRYWMLDGLGSKGEPIAPVLREFNGLLMRRIALLALGSNPAQVPYTVREVDRRVIMYFDAGSDVYELINPQGIAFVMQAYCTGVDSTLDEKSLPDLAERLALPTGWKFQPAPRRGVDRGHFAFGGNDPAR